MSKHQQPYSQWMLDMIMREHYRSVSAAPPNETAMGFYRLIAGWERVKHLREDVQLAAHSARVDEVYRERYFARPRRRKRRARYCRGKLGVRPRRRWGRA